MGGLPTHLFAEEVDGTEVHTLSLGTRKLVERTWVKEEG